jgi:aconitase B
MTLGNAIAILRRNGVGVRAGEMDCTVEVFDVESGDSYGRCTCEEVEDIASAALIVEAIGVHDS